MSMPFTRRFARRLPLRYAAALVLAPTVALGAFPDAAAAAEDATTPQPYESAVSAIVHAVRERVETQPPPPPPAPRPCRYAGGETRDVPIQITEIFKCHLREVGVSERRARQMAAEAVMVAHCESRFDPNAVVFGGRYRDVPHPNGNRYSAAGVFQFIRRTADSWINGGYSNVHDIRLNIDAAARLFIHNRSRGYRGWEDWACAAANDGFKVGSVLPGWPGGPAHLPAWVYYD